MRILESTADKLVVASGSRISPTISTFDKHERVARVTRQILFWRRPEELPLAEIDDVRVSEYTDAASGTTIYIPVVHASSGHVVPLSRGNEDDAADVAERVRHFLQLPAA
jgi:hypothetical protein